MANSIIKKEQYVNVSIPFTNFSLPAFSANPTVLLDRPVSNYIGSNKTVLAITQPIAYDSNWIFTSIGMSSNNLVIRAKSLGNGGTISFTLKFRIYYA